MKRVSLVALAGKTSQRERGRDDGNDTSGTSSHNSCCMQEEEGEWGQRMMRGSEEYIILKE